MESLSNTQGQSKVIEVEKVELTRNERGEKMVNDYILKETIGRGGYSKIKRAIKNQNQGRVCYKDSKQGLSCETKSSEVYEEIEIWKDLEHKNIVQLYEILDDPEEQNIYIVMELVELGQAMIWEEEQRTYSRNPKILKYFEEKIPEFKSYSIEDQITIAGKNIFSQLAEGLAYIHSMRIVHRDLKLENFLFSREGVVKIIDFTVSKRLENPDDDICYDYEGTPSFTAPEVAFCSKEGYRGFLNDVWSYGVCLYVYIFGVLPFDGESELEIQINAKNNPLVFPKPIAKDLEVLLTALLNKNPENRPLAAEILSFDWFKSK